MILQLEMNQEDLKDDTPSIDSILFLSEPFRSHAGSKELNPLAF